MIESSLVLISGFDQLIQFASGSQDYGLNWIRIENIIIYDIFHT